MDQFLELCAEHLNPIYCFMIKNIFGNSSWIDFWICMKIVNMFPQDVAPDIYQKLFNLYLQIKGGMEIASSIQFWHKLSTRQIIVQKDMAQFT